MDEPRLRCWMQDSVVPKNRYDIRPGRWVAEDQWPSSGIRDKSFHINKDGLSEQAGPPAKISISSPQTVGLVSGAWCSYGVDPDQAGDQRTEAGGSLNFDTDPLDDDLEILGAPVATIKFSCDRSEGLIAVCLNEVLPDGAVTRITYGIRNLTHLDSHLNPEPLVPGNIYRISIQLNDIAHRFAMGNRIRLSLSNAYWPTVWPSPRKNKLTISTSACSLAIPVRKPQDSDSDLPEFPESESAPPLRKTVEQEGKNEFTITKNIETGNVVLRNWYDEGKTIYDDYQGWTVASTHEEFFSIHPEDPCSASCDITWTERFSRGEWEVSSRTNTVVTSTSTHFNLNAQLEAWHGKELVHERKWNRSFKRKLV